MIIDVDGLRVYFPYQYIYPEQYAYMLDLKRVLDAAQRPADGTEPKSAHCMLEMPSGTGKTISLLSLITSYQLARPSAGQLVYCSRTVPEIEKVLEELKGVVEYQQAHVPNYETPLAIGLSARRALCINPEVRHESEASAVDAKCRERTASWVRERAEGDRSQLCGYYEDLEDLGENLDLLNGVYSLADLRSYGEEHNLCPYFVSRRMLKRAKVIVFTYPYVLDPKVAEHVSSGFSPDAIVVFDEAHNIDNICIEALSCNISKRVLDAATANLASIGASIDRMKETNERRLQDEYQRLVEGLAASGIGQRPADDVLANPVLPRDILREAVPGNIRKQQHFVGFMKRFVEYLKTRLRVSSVVQESPLAFLANLLHGAAIEAKPLQFFSERLASLLRTLEVTGMHDFAALTVVATFATLVSTYSKGFSVIIEPYDDRTPSVPDPVLQFCCLDSALAVRPVFERFRSVIITSGTLSPLEMYPRILNFKPVLMRSLGMSLTRDCVCPLVVVRGSDQVAISSKFDVRNDPAVVRNFGQLLVEMAAVVPDGMVAFFTSYLYMEQIVASWSESGILNEVLKHKLVFVETTDFAESSLALDNYKRACDSGRGAVLLSVARGKVSEGIDFDHHYGRCVILFGIPYVYTQSKVLRARLEYLRANYQIRENDFLTFDAMRTGAQCMGRVIRSKNDYGLMVFADKRYQRSDKRDKLPRWIGEALRDSQTGLSTEMAVTISQEYLRRMAQPRSKAEQLGSALWSEEHVRRVAEKDHVRR